MQTSSKLALTLKLLKEFGFPIMAMFIQMKAKSIGSYFVQGTAVVILYNSL